MDPNSVIITM